jgi:hypothetical protein
MHTFPRLLCVSFLVLAVTAGAVQAADKPDPNIDPVLPDPQPNNATLPPGTATAGTADPGPALRSMPVSAAMLAGQGPGCTTLSPCAVDSPPLERLPRH